MAIHKVWNKKKMKNEFAISAYQAWCPGVYETESAANYAFRFDDDDLSALQDRKDREAGGTGGVITTEDLRELRRELKAQEV